jgi:hypothetical protein
MVLPADIEGAVVDRYARAAQAIEPQLCCRRLRPKIPRRTPGVAGVLAFAAYQLTSRLA